MTTEKDYVVTGSRLHKKIYGWGINPLGWPRWSYFGSITYSKRYDRIYYIPSLLSQGQSQNTINLIYIEMQKMRKRINER